MYVLQDIAKVRGQLDDWRAAGESIALVPTMGNLHRGHLSLLDIAAGIADRVVATIFVNPMQFDRAEEVNAYPRTFPQDRELLVANGVDLLFCPDTRTVYPHGIEYATRVEVPGVTEILCGAHRPGHFTGVTTVVSKLFNIVQPQVAVFGEKDYQQLHVIRRVAEDLNMPVRIVDGPTVREPDGLAMSSRNNYLSAAERRRAPLLHRTLSDIAERILAGEREFGRLEQSARLALHGHGFEPDYVSILGLDLGSPVHCKPAELIVLAAAWLGKARLLDNVPLRHRLEQSPYAAVR